MASPDNDKPKFFCVIRKALVAVDHSSALPDNTVLQNSDGKTGKN